MFYFFFWLLGLWFVICGLRFSWACGSLPPSLFPKPCHTRVLGWLGCPINTCGLLPLLLARPRVLVRARSSYSCPAPPGGHCPSGAAAPALPTLAPSVRAKGSLQPAGHCVRLRSGHRSGWVEGRCAGLRVFRALGGPRGLVRFEADR